jgi:hypothetical protein
MERSEKNRKEYLQQLRTDAYIKISEQYRSAVEPLLNIAPKAAATTTVNNTTTDKKTDNKRP